MIFFPDFNKQTRESEAQSTFERNLYSNYIGQVGICADTITRC